MPHYNIQTYDTVLSVGMQVYNHTHYQTPSCLTIKHNAQLWQYLT